MYQKYGMQTWRTMQTQLHITPFSTASWHYDEFVNHSIEGESTMIQQQYWAEHFVRRCYIIRATLVCLLFPYAIQLQDFGVKNIELTKWICVWFPCVKFECDLITFHQVPSGSRNYQMSEFYRPMSLSLELLMLYNEIQSLAMAYV